MRCKVICNLKQPSNETGIVYLYFTPVTSGSDENKLFFKYTPGGQVMFNVVDKKTSDEFEVGKEYYLDFSPASE